MMTMDQLWGVQMNQVSFVAGAGDYDVDGRYSGAACLGRTKDARLMFFAGQGYSVETFREEKLLPLLLKERIDYQRDIYVLDEVKLSLSLAGFSEDGTRFTLRSELFRSDGKLAVKVSSTCAWLDLNLQKLTYPPSALITALKSLPMTADYQVLPSALKQ